MTTTVYATKGGHAFHAQSDCRARQAGQDLHDWDLPDDAYLSPWAWPTMHAVQATTIPAAMGAGQMPCGTCLPDLLANWYRTPSENDFGHEPLGYDGALFCRRCYVIVSREWVDAYDSPRHQRVRDIVPWPCTSAVILGLVPREAVTV